MKFLEAFETFGKIKLCTQFFAILLGHGRSPHHTTRALKFEDWCLEGKEYKINTKKNKSMKYKIQKKRYKIKSK